VWATTPQKCRHGSFSIVARPPDAIIAINHRAIQGGNPETGAAITCHYVGTLLDGTKFDSSRDRNSPFNFTLGAGVITGWSEGVATMKRGEVADFEIVASKAYGESGSPPKIPGGATLKFEIELISWESDDSASDVSVAKDGGVMKSVLKKGEGYDKPKTLGNCVVNAKFKVQAEDGAIPINTKADGAEPLSFTAGDEDEIPGIEQAVLSMTKGEVASFVLSPKYGYGVKGNAELNVPATSTLVGTLELVDFTNLKQIYELTDEERIANAGDMRVKGNEFFKLKKYKQAIARYENAIEGIGSQFVQAEEPQKSEAYAAVTPCYLNAAACQLKLNLNQKAMDNCDKVLVMEKDSAKAHYRKGCALTALGQWSDAKKSLKRCLELEPGNKAAGAAQAKNQKLIDGQAAKDKKMFGGMFDKMGAATAAKEAKAKAEKAAARAAAGTEDICGDGSILKTITKAGEGDESPEEGA
jgi:FK506-binding protein 4/5